MPRVGRPPRLRFPTSAPVTEPVTKAAFARLLECPKPRVTEWVARGTIGGDAVTPDGRIVPAVALAQLRAAGCFADPPPDVAEPTEPPSAAGEAGRGVTYDEARTANELLKAHRALLELRARHEGLVEAEVADGILFDAMRAVRDGAEAWPVREAAEMALRLQVDPAVLLVELQRATRRFLASLADPKADWRQRSRAQRARPLPQE